MREAGTGRHLRRGELSALEQRRADGVDALVVEARHLDVRADLDRGGREPLANVVEDGLPQVGVEACAGDEEGWPRRRRVRRGRKGGGEGREGARRAEEEAPRTGERRSVAEARRREGEAAEGAGAGGRAPGMVSSLKMESGSPMAARNASYACLNLAYSGHAVWA